MVIRNILLALNAGLGHGETCIFPIHIFKVKEGVNYNEGDPNYDLFRLSCKVSAKRLFPNYTFLDSPSTCNTTSPVIRRPRLPPWAAAPGSWAMYMTPPGRSPTPGATCPSPAINLPRLAIESHGDEQKFYQGLEAMLELVAQQLLDRFEIQASKHVYNFPFLMDRACGWIPTS